MTHTMEDGGPGMGSSVAINLRETECHHENNYRTALPWSYRTIHFALEYSDFCYQKEIGKMALVA